MTLLALACMLVAAPIVDISVAPDQPVPYIYADEPVIVQFKSSAEAKAIGRVSITDDDGNTVVIPLPELTLRANGAHWQTLDGAPVNNGRYTAQVTLSIGEAKVESNLVYCRIERPNDDAAAPLRIYAPGPDAPLMHALRGIPARDLILPFDPNTAQPAVEAAIAAGFHVMLTVDPAAVADPAQLGAIAATLGEKVAGWRVTIPEAGVAALEPVVNALHQAGSRAPIELLAPTDSDVAKLFADGAGRLGASIAMPLPVPSSGRSYLFQRVAESAGYESYPISSNYRSDPNLPGIEMLYELLAGHVGTNSFNEVDTAALFANGKFGDAFPLFSGLAHRIAGFSYAGTLQTVAPLSITVYRKADTWLIATWYRGVPGEQALPVGGASNLQLHDANNNALTTPEIVDGAVHLKLGPRPLYLEGKGGAVLALAARNMARLEADAFVKNKAFQKELPSELIEMIKPITQPTVARTDRVTFFALLRVFPVLEQKWHDGTLRRDVAVPAMASLSRLVRNLCVLEQESGEPFIELLQETNARSAEYQSQYLTSTGSTAETHERADWLIAEIGRLTAEAKSLAESGRGIEAVGVASLAEWRARSLEFARNADPLGAPEKPKVEDPAPPTEQAKPKPEEKKPSGKPNRARARERTNDR